MHALANTILILGVCLGVIGAAGFTDPARANPKLLFAPPREGIRGDLFQELKGKLLGEEGESHG